MTGVAEEGEDPITCIIEHFQEAFWYQLFFLLSGISLALFVAYIALRRHQTLMAFQGAVAGFAVFLLPTALCKVLGPIFLYSILILGGTLLIVVADRSLARRLKTMSLPRRFKVRPTGRQLTVHVVASQRAFAFTFHRRIYVSVGLLEVLDRPGLEAVLLHEEHHARRGPSPILASFLALLSFTFTRATDEAEAHRHARQLSGEKPLLAATSALFSR